MMRVPTPSLPWFRRRYSLSQILRKPKPLPTIWRLFQPVTNPAVAEAIEMFDVKLRSSVMAPASESKLTNREEVQDAIRGLKISKAPGPNVIPEQGLEGSPTASGIPPGPVFQRDPPHPSLPYSVEARSYDLYT